MTSFELSSELRDARRVSLGGGETLSLDDLRALLSKWKKEEKKEEEEEQKKDEKEEPRDEIWRSKCCNSKDGTVVSQAFLTYTLTSFISLVVLFFALYQLAFDSQEDSLTPLWISLVSSIGSLHLPSPLEKK